MHVSMVCGAHRKPNACEIQRVLATKDEVHVVASFLTIVAYLHRLIIVISGSLVTYHFRSRGWISHSHLEY